VQGADFSLVHGLILHAPGELEVKRSEFCRHLHQAGWSGCTEIIGALPTKTLASAVFNPHVNEQNQNKEDKPIKV